VVPVVAAAVAVVAVAQDVAADVAVVAVQAVDVVAAVVTTVAAGGSPVAIIGAARGSRWLGRGAMTTTRAGACTASRKQISVSSNWKPAAICGRFLL